MKRLIPILTCLLLIFLVACNPGVPEEDPTTEPSERSTPARDDTSDTPEAPVATDRPVGYPSPTPLREPTRPPGYPEPEVYPTLTPKYPAAEDARGVWILRPLGVQCTDPSTYEFATIDDAVAALEAAGVEVLESEMVSLAVCESCDCPTSQHFRALIDPEDLATAVSEGWEPEIGG